MTRDAITLVKVPMWGMTMLDGEMRAWLVGVGDTVQMGAPIAELETGKITGEVEAPAAGVVRRLLAMPGDVVLVGALIGVIADQTATEEEIDEFLSRESTDPPGS
jgi:pyruvate dehydrogenase E2 component (dihydrolipoamide acetyltransferase)